MRLAEVHDLLTYIAEFDNRRFGDDTAIAWHDVIGQLDLADCREAVRRHFATSTDYLMPAHIVRLAAEFDRERRRAEREAAEALQAKAIGRAAVPTRDRSPEVSRLLAAVRDRLPPVTGGELRRPEVLAWDRERARHLRAVPNPHYNPTAKPQPPSEVEDPAS